MTTTAWQKWPLTALPPRFEFIARDVGLGVVDVVFVLATYNMLIKQGIIPRDIMK